MENKREMPVFDPAAIKEMDEAAIDEYGREYTEAVEGYVRESIAQGLAPIMEDMDRKARESDERAALLSLGENEEYYDFAEKREAALKLLEGMPSLGELEPTERYTAAYLMVKGAEALAAHNEAPAPRKPEEIADEAWGNPEVMRELSRRIAESGAEALPLFPGTAAGQVREQDTPKTLAAASERARKHFRI